MSLRKHQLINISITGDNTVTVVVRRTVSMGVRRGLWDLSMLFGRIRVGGLIMTRLMILVLVLPAHGGEAKKEWEILISWPRRRSLSMCQRA